MDIATILGFIAGAIIFSTVAILGGNVIIFVSIQSVLVVLGGTMAGILISYNFTALKKIPDLLKVAFKNDNVESERVIEELVSFAEKARREGLLALEDDAAEMEDEFLKKGIQLVVDGTDPELVRNILETKLTFLAERHYKGRSIFSTMGQLAPAFGMIGTLIGLVQMLSQLDDPDQLGSGMAVALITTLYGALLANWIFIPLAKNLQTQSNHEIHVKEVIIEGILSIQAGENPRIVKEKLNAFLSEGEKTEVEERIGAEMGAAENV
ncbi:MotA/TolQ/ExbB proton channel family protein [Halanaerobium sp. Z-7514]|uniref:MotA/TolQ/ExbB proton channel family protein n=1 Tax=Halanaerobium polyolivorans TaxID=2886943 RepID=A0AAW4X076_9FIRM|nr:MotA/TolQ/ExbB proton channel family protein [Halanaerobium polyolivorans]MCC3145199.1 MotA/TolQ/ExbB proton channel family protein [Halanaerobium polyolivorans]